MKRLDKETDHLKIIYVSVYSKSAAKRLGYLKLSDNIVRYVEKPFSISELLKTVKKAFEAESSESTSLPKKKLYQRIKGQLDPQGILDLREEFPAQSINSIKEAITELDSENEVIISSSRPTLLYSPTYKIEILKQVVQF